jgi:hypothetical protein
MNIRIFFKIFTPGSALTPCITGLGMKMKWVSQDD